MNYNETIEFLFSKLPYFTRDGKSAITKNLDNTIKLLEFLGNPHHKLRCIHIAGTNGKGSVSNMLAAIFQAHGFKTGLYTSPHLKDFRERIRIDGDMISETFVVEFIEKIRPALDIIKPSFFEITVALCFYYFDKYNVDYAIIEAGIGGRLDSTNIISPILSVITNIGMDHTDILGDTLKLIAYEKAGIIKPGTPVVIGESSPETDEVFRNKAAEMASEIYFADRNVTYYNTEISSDLKGEYQQKNLVTVMQAVEVLNLMGILFDQHSTARALMNVKNYTRFKGRWEILGENPKIIADTGHNEHGLKLVFEQLAKEKYRQLHIVFGMLKDKNRTKIIELLPTHALYYFCKPDLPRGLDASLLAEECRPLGLKGDIYFSVSDALEAAKKKAGEEDLIFVGGSTFVVAEII